MIPLLTSWLLCSLLWAQEINMLAPIEVIDQQPLRSTPVLPSNLDQLLSSENNVTTIAGPRSSALRPQVRGLDADKLSFNLDGVPVTPFTNHDGVNVIDPELVETVEVAPSPEFFQLGPGAIGGGLQLHTKTPQSFLQLLGPGSAGGQQKFAYSSANNALASTTHLFGQNQSWAGLISYHRRHSQDQKLANGQRLFHSAYQDENFLWKNSFHRPSGDYQINLQQFNRQERAPLNPALNDPRAEGNSDNQLLRQQAQLQYQTPSKVYLVNLYGLQSFLEKKRLSDGRQDRRALAAAGLNVAADYPHWKWGSFLHFDSQEGRRNGGPLSSFPSGQSFHHGLMLQGNFLLERQQQSWELTPALRYEGFQLPQQQRGGNYWSPSFLLSWWWSDWLQNLFQLGSALAPPTLSQLYADGLHHVGDGFLFQDNYFMPNPSLRPERSWNFEVGQTFRWHPHWSVDWRHFHQELHDYIYAQTTECVYGDTTWPCVQMSSGTTQFINLHRAQLQGNELKVSYQLPQWWAQLAFAAIRGKNLTTGEYLSNLPADTWSLQWRWQTSQQNAQVGHQLRIVRSQRRINSGSTERIDATSGYSVHDLFAGLRLGKGLQLEARIENVFNKNYRRHATVTPATGRDFRCSVSYQTNFF